MVEEALAVKKLPSNIAIQNQWLPSPLDQSLRHKIAISLANLEPHEPFLIMFPIPIQIQISNGISNLPLRRSSVLNTGFYLLPALIKESIEMFFDGWYEYGNILLREVGPNLKHG